MDQKLLQARPCRNRSTKKVTWSVARGVSSPVTRHTALLLDIELQTKVCIVKISQSLSLLLVERAY